MEEISIQEVIVETNLQLDQHLETGLKIHNIPEKLIFLYKIRCEANGKHYIGQTNNPDDRWNAHKYEANRWAKDNSKTRIMLIDKKMAEKGVEHFIFEIIASSRSYEDANDIEIELIEQYGSHVSTGRGYNVSRGGQNVGSGENHPATKLTNIEVLNLVELHNTGEYTYQELSIIFQVSKDLVGDVLRGNTRSDITNIEPGSTPNIKRKCSEETRQKLSISHKGQITWNTGTKGKGICKSNIGSFKPKITWPEDNDLLLMVNENGLTQVAKSLGINPSSLYEHMEKHKLKHSRSRIIKFSQMTDEKAIELILLSQYGQNNKELAEYFNISIAAVNGILAGRTFSKITGIISTNKKAS